MKISFMQVCGKEIHVEGKWIRVAAVAEGYDFPEDPEAFVHALKHCGTRLDLFTFIQPLSETSPQYGYPMERDNLAAMRITTYEHWFTEQIKGKTRNMLRKAEKLGVTVSEVPFDDSLIASIATLNDESPFRQGRRYWHYGDDLATVRRKNETFLDRSIFLEVCFNGEKIGYAKMVTDEERTQAGLMQILSMVRHRDKAPNNMLIAQAVRSCAQRGIPYLWYAKFSYGKKQQDSLSDFKLHNGFQPIGVPRYYVPLTSLGRTALQLRLHHGLMLHVPWTVRKQALRFRNYWYGKTLRAETGK